MKSKVAIKVSHAKLSCVKTELVHLGFSFSLFQHSSPLNDMQQFLKALKRDLFADDTSTCPLPRSSAAFPTSSRPCQHLEVMNAKTQHEKGKL